MFQQKHPVKKNAELTLKERALFAPRFPTVYFMFHDTDLKPVEGEVMYQEIGDMPLEVFVRHYSKSQLEKFREVGPKTIKILSKVLREAGLQWE